MCHTFSNSYKILHSSMHNTIPCRVSKGLKKIIRSSSSSSNSSSSNYSYVLSPHYFWWKRSKPVEMSKSEEALPEVLQQEKSLQHFTIDHKSIKDADGSEGLWSSAMYTFRSIWIPATPKTVIDAQKNIFARFVKADVAHKRFQLADGHYINYVDIDNRKTNDTPGTAHSTLLLTHGYGSGLAFFFGA